MTDNQSFVTFFFNKRLGTITIYSTGTVNMSYYGEEQPDMELIYDYVTVPLDSDSRAVMKRPSNFVVDPATKEIFKKEEAVTKYKVKEKKVKDKV